MAYATIADVLARMTRTLTDAEQAVATTMLDDAAVIIDAYNSDASEEAKRVVSCRMVMRTFGDGDIPIGATQGSMSGLGYSQSWTIGSNGAAGELYVTKAERKLLGCGDRIGSYSPVEDMT